MAISIIAEATGRGSTTHNAASPPTGRGDTAWIAALRHAHRVRTAGDGHWIEVNSRLAADVDGVLSYR